MERKGRVKNPLGEPEGGSKKPVENSTGFRDGMRAELRFLDAVLGAITLSFDNHCLGVMEEAVQDGGGEGGIIVEDACPVFVDLIGGNDGRGFLVPPADDLEQKIGAIFVDGQI